MKKKGSRARFEVRIGKELLIRTNNRKRARKEFCAYRAQHGAQVKFFEMRE